MFDIALSDAGAKIPIATSCNEDYPPENIIDGRNETFWTSTGMFPQEVVISFASVMSIKSITLTSYNIKELQIEKCTQPSVDEFEFVQELKLEHNEGHMATTDIHVKDLTANHLRFVITSGHDHFVCINKVHVEGHALHAN